MDGNFMDINEMENEEFFFGKKARARRANRRAKREERRTDRREARQARKADRQEARQTKRQTRVEARADRKQSRIDRRQDRRDAAKMERIARRQDRKDKKADQRHERKAMKIAQKGIEIEQRFRDQQGMGDYPDFLPQDPIKGYYPETEQDEQYFPEIPLSADQQRKAISYLERKGRSIMKDENGAIDSNILAGQYQAERDAEIQRRYEERLAEVQDASISNSKEWLAENLPDHVDIWDEILEEEANSFAFNGDGYDNFIDPATASTLIAAAKRGLGAYRERRFQMGKRWNGMTREQWNRKQALKQQQRETLPSPIGEVKDEITTREKQAFVRDNQGKILLVGGLIVATIVAAFLIGRRK